MSGAPPTAAIVVIGDEVLSGKVTDLNSPFLIRELYARGVKIVEVRVIADQVDGIAATVRELSLRVDHLFTTGGIGPTHDDVTLEAVAKAVSRPLAQSETIAARIRARHPEASLRMAMVPEGAQVELAGGGVVPVISVDNVYVLPGVPSLMRACFEKIGARFVGTPFVSRAIYLDAHETEFAEVLAGIQQAHREVAIGSYPRFDAAPYRVKVTVDGADAKAVAAAYEEIRAKMDPSWIVVDPGE
ncbi:MAG: competence/damage-inducible protein A [Deltaproteobacteria bacterium]|nr:competence/damage-inducible protein A [Deltaproteobacteria bacterium]